MEPKQGYLLVKLIEARKLASKDVGGGSDPYAIVGLLNSKGEQGGLLDTKFPQYRSKVIQKNLNPVWKDEGVYEFKPDIDGKARILHVQLWDEDVTYDDFLGQFNINPRDLPDGQLVDNWFPVKNRPGKKEGVTGDVHLQLLYTRPPPDKLKPIREGPEEMTDPAYDKNLKISIEASNIANLGTDLEKQVRLEAARHEAAWKSAGQKPGLEIWRIEKFTVKAWPVEEYGKFYNGDSYIILHTYKKSPDSDALAWDVHFWLGAYTSQDEAGTAAYKTVELDDFLGGAPVQHREVQGYESELFLSYFPQTIQILGGGIESGFKHVKPAEYACRLLHLKGRKFVRIMQVELTTHSLNSGDAFILDDGMTIYQWQGKSAGPNEKVKAGQIARSLKDERGSKPNIIVIDESVDSGSADFWNKLGGKAKIATAAEGGSDLESDKKPTPKCLYRLSDASGKLEFTLMAKDKVFRKHITSADAFIFDTGYHVFAWVGKAASIPEKSKALKYAQDYLKEHNRPDFIPISRILDGGENVEFEAAFDG
eukprot:Phypoly_transcript_06611.p1 GENE.Phypoly_transcript_06611~~Phypoly_transcript_06611.p1  ORF type:complete len:537 (+),score=113.66 Phypoly_transcript_06611:97-1707(+)